MRSTFRREEIGCFNISIHFLPWPCLLKRNAQEQIHNYLHYR
jgi:hypothetical protein